MKRRNYFTGTILGLAVGWVLGVLMAPKSGKETQEDIKRKLRQIAGDAQNQVSKMQNQLGAKVDKLKQVAQELGEEAREESQGLVARAEVMKQELRNLTQSLTEGTQRTKSEATGSARTLMDQGATLMGELEDVTKRLMKQAKAKLRRDEDKPAGEAIARLQELERNGQNED